MARPIEIDPVQPSVAKLVEGSVRLPAILAAAVEGRLGRALGDDPDSPLAVRIDLGCYSILAGDADAAISEDLILGVEPPIELVYPDARWRRRILRLLGDRVSDRPMQTYLGDSMDRPALSAMVSRLPDGGYRLVEMDPATAAQLDGGLEPHGVQTYGSAEALVRDGMAWGIQTKGPGAAELVCAATS